jgi:hypothetical protein
MTVTHLSFRVPYSAHRDCMIVIQPLKAAFRAVCVDAATRLTIGSPSVPRGPDGRRPAISATDVIGMVGGYRLASAAVDIEADELAQRSQRISDELRLRRRVRWRRSVPWRGRTNLRAAIAAGPLSDDGSGTVSA